MSSSSSNAPADHSVSSLYKASLTSLKRSMSMKSESKGDRRTTNRKKLTSSTQRGADNRKPHRFHSTRSEPSRTSTQDRQRPSQVKPASILSHPDEDTPTGSRHSAQSRQSIGNKRVSFARPKDIYEISYAEDDAAALSMDEVLDLMKRQRYNLNILQSKNEDYEEKIEQLKRDLNKEKDTKTFLENHRNTKQSTVEYERLYAAKTENERKYEGEIDDLKRALREKQKEMEQVKYYNDNNTKSVVSSPTQTERMNNNDNNAKSVTTSPTQTEGRQFDSATQTKPGEYTQGSKVSEVLPQDFSPHAENAEHAFGDLSNSLADQLFSMISHSSDSSSSSSSATEAETDNLVDGTDEQVKRSINATMGQLRLQMKTLRTKIVVFEGRKNGNTGATFSDASDPISDTAITQWNNSITVSYQNLVDKIEDLQKVLDGQSLPTTVSPEDALFVSVKDALGQLQDAKDYLVTLELKRKQAKTEREENKQADDLPPTDLEVKRIKKAYIKTRQELVEARGKLERMERDRATQARTGTPSVSNQKGAKEVPTRKEVDQTLIGAVQEFAVKHRYSLGLLPTGHFRLGGKRLSLSLRDGVLVSRKNNSYVELEKLLVSR